MKAVNASSTPQPGSWEGRLREELMRTEPLEQVGTQQNIYKFLYFLIQT